MDMSQRIRKYIRNFIQLDPSYAESEYAEGWARSESAIGNALTRIVGEPQDNDMYEIVILPGSEFDVQQYELFKGTVANSITYTCTFDQNIPSPLWHISYTNIGGETFVIGSIHIRFDRLSDGEDGMGFGWTDGVRFAGTESVFSEAVRMLAITHMRQIRG